jgi:hypothetical protein
VLRAKTKELVSGRTKATTTKRRENRETKKGGIAPAQVKTGPTGADPIRTTLKGLPLDPVAPKTEIPPPPLDQPVEEIPKPPPSNRGGSRSEFMRLLEEVESGFDAILVEPGTVPPPKPEAEEEGVAGEPTTTENIFDHAQAEKLFHELVVANAQPIRDFMIEIRLGEPHADWITFCEPAVRAILRSAEGMGHAELVQRLRVYLAALSRAAEAATAVAPEAERHERAIRGEVREKIIDTYSELIVFFPEAFALEAESNAREAVIVSAVLAKVPGLFKVGLDRIHATGLASLGLFYVSRPKDIVELTGVSVEVAEEIARAFQEYRRLASRLSPVGGRTEERRLLREAANALAAAANGYDVSAPGSAERKRHRRARALALSDITLYLARLGERSRVERLETLSFEMKHAEVVAFLDETEKKERRAE